MNKYVTVGAGILVMAFSFGLLAQAAKNDKTREALMRKYDECMLTHMGMTGAQYYERFGEVVYCD